MNSAFRTDEDMNFKSTRKDKTKVTIGSLRHHEPINIPFCGDCNHNQEEIDRTCKNKECKDCTVIFDNLDNSQRMLLHWHDKLDHMGFNQLRDLADRYFYQKV